MIVNSEHWEDVYSTLLYCSFKGIEGEFLTSTKHGTIILNGISTTKRVRVVTSSDLPYVFNYPSQIRSKNFAGVDEIVVDSANIELIRDLNDIKNFIFVDDSFGFNAVAVAPYAILTKSWVFLTNSRNIGEIDAIVNSRNPDKILIYGYVDKTVRDTLSKYNPEIIDNEDRFKDNIEIVEKYTKINPIQQVVLTNGEFIEREIMSGVEPILFTGRENVPDQIKEYLKNSDIQIGVLIGNELVGAATNIRRSTGISVMVKFARGARSQAGGVSAVEALDMFPLPTPIILLSIHSIKYNRMNSQLEITYKSDANIPIYFKGTITLISDSDNQKIGDTEPIFIAPGNFKTVIYSKELSSLNNLSAEIFTLFGDNPTSLDRILEARTDIEIIDVIDTCRIDIKSVKYNKQKKAFVIKIKNPSPVNCYANVELKDIVIGYTKNTLSTENPVRILKGKTKNLFIKEELDSDDLVENEIVKLIAYYGEREDGLINRFEGEFPLGIERLTLLTYAIISIILIIIILIIIFVIIKRREKEEEYY